MFHNIFRQAFRVVFEEFKIPSNMGSSDGNNNDIISSEFKKERASLDDDRTRTTKIKRE